MIKKLKNEAKEKETFWMIAYMILVLLAVIKNTVFQKDLFACITVPLRFWYRYIEWLIHPSELNILGGVLITAEQLNYLSALTGNVQTQLNAKAALASPALTGTPTAPTAAVGTNTTQLATTAFVLANSDGVTATTVGAATAGMSVGSLGSYALSDWKLCHIQPVGFNTHTSIEDLEISDIEDHFRKYVNPNNMFVLPKEIGYLGEIDVFIEEQKR